VGFEDKTLQCSECGESFTFTAGEQEFYQSKGYANEPKRCPACRQTRRADRGGGGGRSARQMFPAICSECGKETEVPFEPRDGRPVYCRECYAKTRSN
jgi:CxxC-x17-CxxC domain-containing protein